ncbi:hypothetical protein H9625_16980 [Phocaeicola sp. Sa1CVN1]|uniref:DUF4450 domain-containing protein n=1 Tax=Phocaeicola intestinalis TaxID=2762212 RepID=A0ABR8YCZ9_9BACT|nr:hypothetical protein [Phocaeicola intestinalis]MBD8042095.1 hypothetical protein [Phocaeicola intestinalis]
MILYSTSHENLSNINLDDNDKYSVTSIPKKNVKKTISLGVVAISFLFANTSSEAKSHTYTTFSFEKNTNIKEVNKIVSREEKSNINFLKMRYCMQIQELGLLEENWDGYGATKVLPTCISNAQNIINYKAIICDCIQDIYANPNGTISILWENENEESVGLEIGEKKLSYYVVRKNGNEFINNVPFSELQYNKLSAYIAQL